MKLAFSLISAVLLTSLSYAQDAAVTVTSSSTVSSQQPVLDVDKDTSLENVYGSTSFYDFDIRANNIVPLETLQTGDLASLAPDLKNAIRFDIKGDYFVRNGKPSEDSILSHTMTGLGIQGVYDSVSKDLKVQGDFQVGYLLTNSQSEVIGIILGAGGSYTSDNGFGSRVGGKFLFVKAQRSDSLDKTREPVWKGTAGIYWLPQTEQLDLDAQFEIMSVEPFNLYHGSVYAKGNAIVDYKTGATLIKFGVGASVTLGGLFDVKNLGYNAGQLYLEVGGVTQRTASANSRATYVEVGVRLTGTGDSNPHRLVKDVNKDNPTWLNDIVCRVMVCK